MEDYIKTAYSSGVARALSDYGLLKQANIENVKRFMAEGLSKEEAWKKAYPGEPIPDELDAILSS